MRKNLGINICITLGILLLISGLSQLGKLKTEEGLLSALIGLSILFASLACKRAKSEKNKVNLFFEILFLFLSLSPIIFTISKNLIIQHPVYYVITPLWIIIAYGTIKYKQ
jgi:hypothetical protein